MLKRYNALIHTRPALSEWADVVIAADHEQAMKEKEEQIASLQLYKDATLNKESERERQISALTEELRLSGLRGDSLDRVIEEGVQKELALEAENEKLKEETVCVNCHNALEEKIAILAADNSALREQNSAMSASLEELRPENEKMGEVLEKCLDWLSEYTDAELVKEVKDALGQNKSMDCGRRPDDCQACGGCTEQTEGDDK